MKVTLFSGKKCGVCQALKPKLTGLLGSYSQAGLEIVELEAFPKKAAEYSVFTLPVVVIEVDSKEYGRFVGSFSLKEVERLMKRLITLLEK